MHPFTLTALLVLAASVSADKYQPGQACHTNGECNKNCLDSSWTVILVDGAPALVCDPDKDDTTEYFIINCEKDLDKGRTATTAVCNKVKGQLCAEGCVVSGLHSRQAELRNQIQKACSDNRGSVHFFPEVTLANAQDFAGCNRQ